MKYLILALLAMGCTTVNPGEVGVAVRFGQIQGGVQGPGLYVTALTEMAVMDTRTQTYTMAGQGDSGNPDGSVVVNSREGLPVTLEVSVMFHLTGNDAVDVYRALGTGYADSIVHPIVRSATRDAAAEFIAMDMIDRRVELQARMETLVRTKLSQTLEGRRVRSGAIVVDNLLIRNLDLPQSIDDAIANVQRQRQATAAAQQAVLTSQQEAARNLTIAQGDAAQLLARTRADAEMTAIRANAEVNANRAIAASITPELLAYRRIEMTRAVLGSSNTHTVFLPAGQLAPNLLMQTP